MIYKTDNYSVDPVDWRNEKKLKILSDDVDLVAGVFEGVGGRSICVCCFYLSTRLWTRHVAELLFHWCLQQTIMHHHHGDPEMIGTAPRLQSSKPSFRPSVRPSVATSISAEAASWFRSGSICLRVWSSWRSGVKNLNGLAAVVPVAVSWCCCGHSCKVPAAPEKKQTSSETIQSYRLAQLFSFKWKGSELWSFIN